MFMLMLVMRIMVNIGQQHRVTADYSRRAGRRRSEPCGAGSAGPGEGHVAGPDGSREVDKVVEPAGTTEVGREESDFLLEEESRGEEGRGGGGRSGGRTMWRSWKWWQVCRRFGAR